MFNTANLGLVVLLLLGFWARSNLVASAAAVLLAIRLFRLWFLFPVLEERGVEIGLLFLTLAMLVPFAVGKVSLRDIIQNFWSVPGIIALLSGALATNLNGHGLQLLAENSPMMIGLIVGSILGIVVWGGIPVGPLMAAGIAYLMMAAVQLVTHWFS